MIEYALQDSMSGYSLILCFFLYTSGGFHTWTVLKLLLIRINIESIVLVSLHVVSWLVLFYYNYYRRDTSSLNSGADSKGRHHRSRHSQYYDRYGLCWLVCDFLHYFATWKCKLTDYFYQGIIDYYYYFFRNYFCNDKKVKELYTPTWNGIAAS